MAFADPVAEPEESEYLGVHMPVQPLEIVTLRGKLRQPILNPQEKHSNSGR
jgi:hypothetical protein